MQLPKRLDTQTLGLLLTMLTLFVMHNSKAYTIRMDTLTPLIGQHFYVRCTLNVSKAEDYHSLFEKQFYFYEAERRCFISGWRFCDLPVPQSGELEDFDCMCGSRKDLDRTKIYRFFVFIKKIKKEHNGLQFKCGLSSRTDSQQMDVVMYTKVPENPSYRCIGGEIIFDWEFNPPRRLIKENFIVDRIDWHNVDKQTDKNEKISTYLFEVEQFGTVSKERMKVIEASNNFKKLKVIALKPSDACIVRITTLFDPEALEALQRHKRSNRSVISMRSRPDHQRSVFMSRQRRQDGLLNSTKTTTFTSSTTSTTVVTTTPKRPTTTSPIVYAEEEKIRGIIMDEIKFIVTEPPRLDGEIKIEGNPSITGSLIVVCSLSNLVFFGKPPVNITIWNDDKVLMSRSGTDLLRWSLSVVTGNKYICGLEGRALDCLPPTDHRLVRQEILVSELDPQNTPKPNVDLFLVMYGIELTLCIVLMFWTASLMLIHIKILLTHEKDKLDLAFKTRPTLLVMENLEASRPEQRISEDIDEDDLDFANVDIGEVDFGNADIGEVDLANVTISEMDVEENGDVDGLVSTVVTNPKFDDSEEEKDAV